MPETRGMAYLRSKLEGKRLRVNTRYQYYEMKNAVQDFNLTTPPEFRWMRETLGWCGKAVDALADRLAFREFRDDNFDLNTIYRMNNADVLFDSAVLSALVSSCCFIYISPDAEQGEYPRLQVIDGGNATGIIDPITGLLTEGYAVLARNDNAAPYPLLVPIIYCPDAARPFGHSRISRACMGIVQGGAAYPQALGNQRRILQLPAKMYHRAFAGCGGNGQMESHNVQLTVLHQRQRGRKPKAGAVYPTVHVPLHRAVAHLCGGVCG